MGNKQSTLFVRNDTSTHCTVSVWTAGKVFEISSYPVAPGGAIHFDLEKVWYDVRLQFLTGGTFWQTVYMGGDDITLLASKVYPHFLRVGDAKDGDESVLVPSEGYDSYLADVTRFTVESAFRLTAGDVLAHEPLATYVAAGGSEFDALYKALEWTRQSGIALKSTSESSAIQLRETTKYCKTCHHICKKGSRTCCGYCTKSQANGFKS